MAKMTKKARRAAALKGWRSRKRSNPGRKAKRNKSTRKRVSAALKKYVRSQNPSKVKGHKVKGGRAVTLKNFSGTVIRTNRGQVLIHGRGKK